LRTSKGCVKMVAKNAEVAPERKLIFNNDDEEGEMEGEEEESPEDDDVDDEVNNSLSFLIIISV